MSTTPRAFSFVIGPKLAMLPLLFLLLAVTFGTGCDGETGTGLSDSAADTAGDGADSTADQSETQADTHEEDSRVDSQEQDTADDGQSDPADTSPDLSETTEPPLDTSDADVDPCSLVTGFEKACANHDTCIIGYHQVDCCGSLFALGMDQSERERFDQLEAACVVTYPGCGCPQGPTQAEDGQSGHTIAVRCLDGQCTTFVIDNACEVVDAGYDKTCAIDDDCAIGIHQIDCCGSMAAIGMNASELPRFEREESLCRESLPICDCPTRPTETEDGNSAFDHDQIRVRCVDERCGTYIPE